MRRHELIREIASVVPGFILEDGDNAAAPVVAVSAPTVPAPVSDSPFDADALLESLNGNRDLVAEMVRLCLDEDAPRLVGNLREGLVTRDFSAIEHAAHGMKGLVGEFHAPVAHAAAKQLEDAARGHETEMIPAHAQELLDEFDRLSAALRRFLEE
jgi:HPt (histidine-containing phosphotransfer) domain-containing protein